MLISIDRPGRIPSSGGSGIRIGIAGDVGRGGARGRGGGGRVEDDGEGAVADFEDGGDGGGHGEGGGWV